MRIVHPLPRGAIVQHVRTELVLLILKRCDRVDVETCAYECVVIGSSSSYPVLMDDVWHFRWQPEPQYWERLA